MNKEYTITGLVLGNCWGGGEVAYESEKLRGKDKSYLIRKAKKMLDNGSLDSGMGYESLIGAWLRIRTITTTEIKGRAFERSDYEDMLIGNLTDKQKSFLLGLSNQC